MVKIHRNGKIVDEHDAYIVPAPEAVSPAITDMVAQAEAVILGLPDEVTARLSPQLAGALLLAERKNYGAFIKVLENEIKPQTVEEAEALNQIKSIFGGLNSGKA